MSKEMNYREFLKAMEKFIDEKIKEEEIEIAPTQKERSEEMKKILMEMVQKQTTNIQRIEISRPFEDHNEKFVNITIQVNAI